MLDLTPVLDRILARRDATPPARAVLVGLSGIDGAGKGHVATRLTEALDAAGVRPARITVDGWLSLPSVRFGGPDPGRRFYDHALRLDAMFRDLVLPLREARAIRLEMDFTEETAHAYRRHTWAFDAIDVIVVEGIFIFKPAHRPHFDVAVWVDCSFETALERAVARSQEGLPPEPTVRAYETIYFPAARIHLAEDRPREGADLVVVNDPRLEVMAGADLG
jgi:uridine kinase